MDLKSTGGIAVGVIGLLTALVTNWDKIFKPDLSISAASQAGMYINAEYQAYQYPADPAGKYIANWNRDCISEGRNQLLSHSFAVLKDSEYVVGGAATLADGKGQLLAVVYCYAQEGHLAHSVVVSSRAAASASADYYLSVMSSRMKVPGMTFGQK